MKTSQLNRWMSQWTVAATLGATSFGAAMLSPLASHGLLAQEPAGVERETPADAVETPAPTPVDPIAVDPIPEPQPIDAAEIDRWAAEMDSSSFSERHAAAQKLGEAGKTAFPALERIAQSESREASTRAIEILKRHLDDADETTRNAAKASLERLASCDNAPTARRATQALTPPEPEQQAIQPQFGQMVPAIRVVQARVQVQAQNGVNRISIKENNGVRETEVEEKDRKIKITDDPNNGIKMEVTQKEGDKESKKEYSAKDAAELKEKHPEAHKIYEQFGNRKGNAIMGNRGNIQIQGGNIQIQQGGLIPALPGAPAPGRPAVPVNKDIAKLQIDNISRMIDQVKKTAQDLQNRGLPAGGLDQMIQRLEQTKAQLEQQHGAAEAAPEKPAAEKSSPSDSQPTPNDPPAAESNGASASAAASAAASSDGNGVKVEAAVEVKP